MKNFSKWVYGIIFIMIGLSALFTSLIGAILFLIAGLICIPPACRAISEKINKRPSSKAKISIVVLSVLIGTIFLIGGVDSEAKEKAKIADAKEQVRVSNLPKEQQERIKASKIKLERKKEIERQFSFYDGSHRKLERYVKKMMKDPDTYDHIETRFVDANEYIIITTKFRGANSFGAKVINNVVAKVDIKGNVIEIVSQD